jgi:tripartite-type tricarboxylate transporter receptor subunit TctC
VVVDNRAGAGTIIGTDLVAKAPADGHTLLMGVGTLATAPALVRNVPYDVLRDFAPVIQLASLPFVLVVHPSVPARTLKELITLARARPGELSYASSGSATNPHLSMELFKSTANVFLTHIPYRGTAPAVSDLLGGQVDIMFLPIHVALPQIRAGKLIALGLGSEQRHPLLPNVPTIAESKVGQVNVDMWFGIFAPKNTPNDIVQAYNKEIKLILASEDIQKAFQPQGMDPANSTPEEFGRLVEKDAIRWAALIKSQNIKAE